MSKFGTFAEYPPRSLASAEAALLTAWGSLQAYQDDLVLVGGLEICGPNLVADLNEKSSFLAPRRPTRMGNRFLSQDRHRKTGCVATL